jgi:hypothetical protein
MKIGLGPKIVGQLMVALNVARGLGIVENKQIYESTDKVRKKEAESAKLIMQFAESIQANMDVIRQLLTANTQGSTTSAIEPDFARAGKKMRESQKIWDAIKKLIAKPS